MQSDIVQCLDRITGILLLRVKQKTPAELWQRYLNYFERQATDEEETLPAVFVKRMNELDQTEWGNLCRYVIDNTKDDRVRNAASDFVSSRGVSLPQKKNNMIFGKKVILQVLLSSRIDGGVPSKFGFTGYSFIWKDDTSNTYFLDTISHTLKIGIEGENEGALLSLATEKKTETVLHPICAVFSGTGKSMYDLKIYRDRNSLSGNPSVFLSILSAENLIDGSYIQ